MMSRLLLLGAISLTAAASAASRIDWGNLARKAVRPPEATRVVAGRQAEDPAPLPVVWQADLNAVRQSRAPGWSQRSPRSLAVWANSTIVAVDDLESEAYLLDYASGEWRGRFLHIGQGKAGILQPRTVATAAGVADVWLADTGNDRIVQVDSTGRIVRELPTPGAVPIAAWVVDGGVVARIVARGWSQLLYFDEERTAWHEIPRSIVLTGAVQVTVQGDTLALLRSPNVLEFYRISRTALAPIAAVKVEVEAAQSFVGSAPDERAGRLLRPLHIALDPSLSGHAWVAFLNVLACIDLNAGTVTAQYRQPILPDVPMSLHALVSTADGVLLSYAIANQVYRARASCAG